MLEFIGSQESDTGPYLERLTGKRAAQYLADGTEYKGVSLKKKLTIGMLGALPLFFVMGMMMLYVTVVFRGFGAYNYDLWKMFVTLIAFGIKVLRVKHVIWGLITLSSRPNQPWLRSLSGHNTHKYRWSQKGGHGSPTSTSSSTSWLPLRCSVCSSSPSRTR